MKNTLVLSMIGIFFTISLKAQKTDDFLKSKFILGCPVEIEPIAKQLGFNIISYSNLETGIDTIKVVFGKMTSDEQNGYWISSYVNEKLKTFQTVKLHESELSASLTSNEDITYDDRTKKISVELTPNAVTNEVQYLWLDNNNQKNKIASVIKIEKAIEKDKPFPSLTVKSLKGDNISIKDFLGKYVVINWWATNCGPCQLEIPGLNLLVEKYKSNSDVVFLAVAFDEKDKLEYYLNRKSFNYMQTMGDSEAAKLFGESFPKHIIVNPQGFTTYYSEGGFEGKYLHIEEELKKQLNKG